MLTDAEFIAQLNGRMRDAARIALRRGHRLGTFTLTRDERGRERVSAQCVGRGAPCAYGFHFDPYGESIQFVAGVTYPCQHDFGARVRWVQDKEAMTTLFARSRQRLDASGGDLGMGLDDFLAALGTSREAILEDGARREQQRDEIVARYGALVREYFSTPRTVQTDTLWARLVRWVTARVTRKEIA